MKKYLFLTVLLFSSLILPGCQHSNGGDAAQNSDAAGVHTPKTSFGQAVGAARGVDALADKHNREIEEQAGE